MKNRKNSLPALIITILLMLCLLIAGGVFVLPAITARITKQSPADGQKTDSLGTWLGLQTVIAILSSEKPDLTAPAEETGAAASAHADPAESSRNASSSAAASTAVKKETETASAASSAKETETASAVSSAKETETASAVSSAKEESSTGISEKDSAEPPEKDSTKTPGKDHTETAEKDSAKASEKESAEIPEKDSTEPPEKDSTKTPGKDHTETVEKDSAKASEKESAGREHLEKKAAPGDSLTKLQKRYVRDWEEFHGRDFPLNAPLHNYNWKYLQYDEMGRLHYDGDKNYTVRHGIDVSEFQGRIDWEKVRKSGIDFVFVRAGHRMFESGTLVKDTRAIKNLTRAKKAGLEVGVYVFSQAVTEKEAREEAQLCLDVIRESGVEVTLPVVFDPEIQIEYYARINYIDREQFTDNTLAFCKTIKKAGYNPAVYANCSTETDILDMSRIDGNATIWYADYNYIPESPYQFTFWQYSNTGRVEGIPEAETDLNVWFVEKQQQRQ